MFPFNIINDFRSILQQEETTKPKDTKALEKRLRGLIHRLTSILEVVQIMDEWLITSAFAVEKLEKQKKSHIAWIDLME